MSLEGDLAAGAFIPLNAKRPNQVGKVLAHEGDGEFDGDDDMGALIGGAVAALNNVN